MENSALWHYRSPQGKEFTDAMKELQEEKIVMRDAFAGQLLELISNVMNLGCSFDRDLGLES